MNASEKADLAKLNSLTAYLDKYSADRLQPGEFTIRMFIEQAKARGLNVTWIQAQRQLDNDASLSARRVIDNGRSCKAYRKRIGT